MESADDLGALLLLLLLLLFHSLVVPWETNQGSDFWPKMWQADPQWCMVPQKLMELGRF